MTPEQRTQVWHAGIHRITVDELIAALGIDPRIDRDFVPCGLRQAMSERSAEDVEALMLLAFQFQVSASWAALFAELLEQDWHTKHEDLASALQDIRDPATVDALFRAAQVEHAYLAFDEARALAVKCIWALHDIGTAAAAEKLRVLAQSDVEVIRANAEERLEDLAKRRPDDPVPAYRRARDSRVRRE